MSKKKGNSEFRRNLISPKQADKVIRWAIKHYDVALTPTLPTPVLNDFFRWEWGDNSFNFYTIYADADKEIYVAIGEVAEGDSISERCFVLDTIGNFFYDIWEFPLQERTVFGAVLLADILLKFPFLRCDSEQPIPMFADVVFWRGWWCDAIFRYWIDGKEKRFRKRIVTAKGEKLPPQGWAKFLHEISKELVYWLL